MDQSASKPSFNKPIGGFIVVLCVALAVGGWLYVDMVKNELEQKVESLSTELEASKERERMRAAGEPAPAAQDEVVWQTFAAEIGGNRVQLDLPPGYRLKPSTVDIDALVVVRDPPSDGEAPVMEIHIVDADTSESTANARIVAAPDGTAYGLILSEGTAWQPFDRVVASFKVL